MIRRTLSRGEGRTLTWDDLEGTATTGQDKKGSVSGVKLRKGKEREKQSGLDKMIIDDYKSELDTPISLYQHKLNHDEVDRDEQLTIGKDAKQLTLLRDLPGQKPLQLLYYTYAHSVSRPCLQLAFSALN
ncbi:MAG: hypothetical protein Q9166_005706 [cf. Caloplaca sp. 2 TL-2023]